MGTMFRFEDLLTDSLEENAAMTIDILHQIRSSFSKEPALAKRVPLIIKNKNENDQARFDTLLHYCVDFQTLEYLENNYDQWLADPCAFDSKLKSSQQAFLPQGTRAVTMAEVRRKRPDYLPKIGKTFRERHGAPIIEADTLQKTVAIMVTAAGHYRNWEKELGTQGVALVLGNVWPESSWTKLVGKSGERFKAVCSRLQDIGLPKHAKKYANLEKRLVEYKVDVMLAEDSK